MRPVHRGSNLKAKCCMLPLLAIASSSMAESLLPVITSVSENATSTLITIIGTGFGRSSPLVSLASTQLTVVSASDSSITAQLPTGTVAGTYLITVQNHSTYLAGFLTVALGEQGPQGSAGPAGAPGAQGPAGPAGAPGAKGATGAPGATGATGAPGVQGPAGAIGPQGVTGAIGLQGATGAIGPQGPQGATGAIGPQGPQGLMGSAGRGWPHGCAGVGRCKRRPGVLIRGSG